MKIDLPRGTWSNLLKQKNESKRLGTKLSWTKKGASKDNISRMKAYVRQQGSARVQFEDRWRNHPRGLAMLWVHLTECERSSQSNIEQAILEFLRGK